MRKHPGRLRLPKQALTQPFALRGICEIRQPDCFDGDSAADGGILGAVNHPGRSTAELVQNPISADLIHADDVILSVRPNWPRSRWGFRLHYEPIRIAASRCGHANPGIADGREDGQTQCSADAPEATYREPPWPAPDRTALPGRRPIRHRSPRSSWEIRSWPPTAPSGFRFPAALHRGARPSHSNNPSDRAAAIRTSSASHW